MISTSYSSEENVRLSIDERMRNQLQEYVDEPVFQPAVGSKGTEQSFKWWSVNYTRFTDVSRVARQYLSIPASSVASERIFSAAGTVIGTRRSCLHPSNVEKLVFLNQNLRKSK